MTVLKTMNRIAEEKPARRIQSFETVLPDDVRVKFTRPQRPRMPGRSEFPDRNTLWLAGAIVFGAMIVALAIGLAGRHEAQQLVPGVAAVPGIPVKQPAATPEPASAATPTQTAVATLTPTLGPTRGPRPDSWGGAVCAACGACEVAAAKSSAYPSARVAHWRGAVCDDAIWG
jgi:hypothetical protein